jgi:hypothetical protein
VGSCNRPAMGQWISPYALAPPTMSPISRCMESLFTISNRGAFGDLPAKASRAVLAAGPGSQDSVSVCSDTAVRGSSSDRTAQSAKAPIAYGAVWTSAASNVWLLR